MSVFFYLNNPKTNCRKCGPDTQFAFTCFPTWRPRARSILFWAKTARIFLTFGPHASYLVPRKPSPCRHYYFVLHVKLSSRVTGRCIVAERPRKTTKTNRWRRMWATVINMPTSWCSAMPANCFQTTKRLFTTNRENILSHGWGTRASWLIGRLNKLRPNRYANHLCCPLACLKNSRDHLDIVLQKLGNTSNWPRMYYFMPANMFLDVLNWEKKMVFEVSRVTCEDATTCQFLLTLAMMLNHEKSFSCQVMRHSSWNYCSEIQHWHKWGE